MDVTRNITYRGEPPWHRALVQFLEEEGARVEWSPSAEEEQRGLGVQDRPHVSTNVVSTALAIGLPVGRVVSRGGGHALYR